MDTALFRPRTGPVQTDRPRLLFLGRMVPQKGPDLLVRACLKLDPALDFELVMVGRPGFSADAALTPYEQ